MRVYSIFQSIDGEVSGFYQGRLSTFIRLSGCNLRCKYCDTQYAQKMDSGKDMLMDEILKQIPEKGKVTITGGEPLLQANEGLLNLLIHLAFGKQCDVSVETNGSIPVSSIKDLPFSVRKDVSWIVDFKLLSSGEMEKMNFDWTALTEKDFVKFVVQDWQDFEVALEVKRKLQSEDCQAKFAFSPIYGALDSKELIQWLWEVKALDSIVNLQLHKYLGLVEDK